MGDITHPFKLAQKGTVRVRARHGNFSDAQGAC